MIRVFDTRFHRDRVILSPGEYCTSDEDVILYTVLGSCVSVCIRDPVRGIAGMNHFMLPSPLATSKFFDSDAGRFGLHAMELVINGVLKRGASRPNLRAKVFGGGHVLATGSRTDKVPESNIEFAVTYLEMEGIPILARDVGGLRGRKVAFFSASGDVYVQRLRSNHTPEVLAEETSYRQRLAKSTREATPDLQLFDD